MQQNSLFGEDPQTPVGLHSLFFALLPGDALRERIAGVTDGISAQYNAGGQRVGTRRYHLTLRFLGEAHEFQAERAAVACAAAAEVSAPAFDLQLDRAGSFRNDSIPWWLGCERFPQELQTLFDRLGVALAKHGIKAKDGRSLTPHVTIVRGALGHLHPPVAIEPMAWRVSEFALIHSEVRPRMIHTVLGQWPLAE
ncbi:MAG: RNA 2',3'-cyclic phosphodiesterase [Lysobacter sp.]